MPPSTNQKPGYEDDAQYLDIPQFISVANADGTDIVFCGTDMGFTPVNNGENDVEMF